MAKYTKKQVIALFLDSINYPCKIKENDEYPGYMTYNFNILDVQKFHKEMLSAGFLRNADFEDIVCRYRVNELRDIAQKYNVEFNKCKKEKLIENLINNLSEEVKRKIVNDSGFYVLSDKAIKYLKEYKHLIKFYRYKDDLSSFTCDEYLKYANQFPKSYSENDVFWGALNTQLIKSHKDHLFELGRCTYLSMGKFMLSENKKTNALYYFILTMWIDMNQPYLQEKILEGRNGWIEKDPIAPGIVRWIYENKDYYRSNMIDKIYENQYLPVVIIDKTTFRNMIEDIFNSSIFDEEKYNNISYFETKRKFKIE